MSSPPCPRCGRENDPAFSFCQGCGQALRAAAAAERHCAGCGARLEPSFRFCGHCGRAVAPPAPAPAPASRPTPAPGPPAAPLRSGAPRAVVATPSPGTLEVGQLAAAREATAGQAGLRLVPVRHDGLPGTVHVLGPEGALCGRAQGQLRFADDATVSPEHARFTLRGEGAVVEDLGTVNGTFLRLRAPRPLRSGDEIRLGRQLLRIETVPQPVEGMGARPWGSADPGYRARLSQLLDGGGTGEVFPLRAGENVVGREVGQVSFPADRYVSARHARIDVGEQGMVITDVGSSNGTFVRITGPAPVAPGDQVLLGMQLVRVEG